MGLQPHEHNDINFEKVWLMFQETDKKFQETSEQLKKTEKLLSEKFQDTDKKFQDTDKKIKELAGLFTGQWGKLVEALLTPGCLALFQQIGLALNQTFAYIEAVKNGRKMEIDVMLVNSTELVVIEVKTTARVSHIKKLLKDLEEFKVFFPHYKDCKVYGAIASLRYVEDADVKAMKNGLYVIRATGDSLVRMDMPDGFKAKCF